MRSRLAAIVLSSLMVAATASGEIAPEFGSSITWAHGDAPFRLADLRGKPVLVLFMQSWCPICNGWSPELIGQIDKTYGTSHAVTLLAVKTDGDADGAKEYFKTHGGNPDHWLFAADAGGAYVKSVLGADELWQCAVLDPRGGVVQSGPASMHHVLNGAKVFLLAADDLATKYGAGSSLLLKAAYPTLGRAVTLAEAGCFVGAITNATTVGGKEVKPFRDELMTAISARVDALAATLAEATASSADRLGAFRQLNGYAQALRGSEPGKIAAKAIAAAAKDKALKREIEADADWQQVADKLAKLPDDRRATALAETVPKFVKAYEGTVAAGQAQAAQAALAAGKK